jgi:hypothetical protein
MNKAKKAALNKRRVKERKAKDKRKAQPKTPAR